VGLKIGHWQKQLIVVGTVDKRFVVGKGNYDWKSFHILRALNAVENRSVGFAGGSAWRNWKSLRTHHNANTTAVSDWLAGAVVEL
jgi:hypothetical protein